MLRPGDRFEAEVYRIREIHTAPRHVQEDFRIVCLNIHIPGRVRTYFATVSWSLKKMGREPSLGDEVMVEYGPPHPYDSQPRGRFHIVHLTGAAVNENQIATVSWEPNHQAVYCRLNVAQVDSDIPLSIKATFSGFDRKRLTKGTKVEVARSCKDDARRYHIVRILDAASLCDFETRSTVPLEGTMSKDRVKFFIGCRYYNSPDKLKGVLERALKLPYSESDRLMRSGDGFWIICRPSQFARFMIYRNAAGIQNGFIDLRAELIEPEVDVYTRIASTAGVDRCDVKKVLLALNFSGADIEQRLDARRAEVDVSNR